jgi:hypothetical protein
VWAPGDGAIAPKHVRALINYIIIGSTALGGPWPPRANVTSDFYPGQPSTNFYSPASLSLPPPRQFISIFKTPAVYNEWTFQVPVFNSNLFLVLCCQPLCIAWYRCQDVHPASFPLGFVTFYYKVGLLTPSPTPNLEDQGIIFCLDHHPWPVWHGRPYQ